MVRWLDIAVVGDGDFFKVERSGDNDHRFRRRGLRYDGVTRVLACLRRPAFALTGKRGYRRDPCGGQDKSIDGGGEAGTQMGADHI